MSWRPPLLRPVCLECGRPQYNAGNVYITHSETWHIMKRREARGSPLWRALLTAAVLRAITRGALKAATCAATLSP